MRLEAVQTIEAMGALHAPTAHSHCLIYGAALSVSAPQDSDAATRKALVDFSYHMALGNMDEAFRAVRSIWASGRLGQNAFTIMLLWSLSVYAVGCRLRQSNAGHSMREHA